MQARGRSVCLPPSFAYRYSALANLCRLTEAAESYLAWLDKLGEKVGFEQIDVVGHSNGGLIAMLAEDLIEKGEADCRVRVRKLVTMASPFGGLPFARALGVMVPCCRDLTVRSEVLVRALAQKHLIVQTLVAERDFLVPPEHQFLTSQLRTVMKGFQHMDFIVGTDEKLARTAEEVVKWLRSSS